MREIQQEIRQYSLGIGIMLVQLVNLKLIVHGTLEHLALLGVVQVADGTTRIGKDDALGRHITVQHLFK